MNKDFSQKNSQTTFHVSGGITQPLLGHVSQNKPLTVEWVIFSDQELKKIKL